MTFSTKPIGSGGLATAGILAVALGLACGGGGGATTSLSTNNTGPANILVTDAPSDSWSTVQFNVLEVTLRSAADHSKTVVVFSGNASINLVDLDSLGELLATAKVPTGAYDQAKITLDTAPADITLVPQGSSTAVASNLIHVVGGGTTSTVTVDLSSAPLQINQVPSGGSNAVQIDFDLAHPLFINVMPSGAVVINFKLLRKAVPADLRLIQLHRVVGTIGSVVATGSTFAVNSAAGRTLTFTTDGSTLFYDADSKPPLPGSFSGLAASDGVMVASRLQDDGSLYAVRVWYCSAASEAALPIWKWSPEGHVVSVNAGAGSMIVDNADGHPRTITVNGSTTYTWQRTTPLPGTFSLANIRRGFKVCVDVADPLATPLVATNVNIERAVDSGYIDTSTSSSGLVYGQPALANLRTYPYSTTPVFSWWDFEQPSSASPVVSDFLSALQGAGTTRVTGFSDLAWDSTGLAWDAANAILTPVALPRATITTGYNGTGTVAGTMVISYTDPLTSATVAKTITVNPVAGGGQTVVLLVNPKSGVVTTALDPAANWVNDLTPAGTTSVWVAAVPTATGLDAYSVIALQQ